MLSGMRPAGVGGPDFMRIHSCEA